MRAGLGSDVRAAQHARQFLAAIRSRETREVAGHAVAIAVLGHAKVRVRMRRHLRQMRDAQHLSPRTERLQEAADGRRDCAADAAVHFVEYERRDLADFTRYHLDRERDARQLTSRCDTRQWPQRLLWMARDP